MLSEGELRKRDATFASLPRLRAAYDAKEQFHELYDAQDKQEAVERLQTWRAGLTKDLRAPFKPLTTALTDWRKEILAYFDNRATNACVESLNSVIHVINRMSRGYSFDVIRAKVLYGHGRRTRMPRFGSGMAGFLIQEDLGVPFSTLLDLEGDYDEDI